MCLVYTIYTSTDNTDQKPENTTPVYTFTTTKESAGEDEPTTIVVTYSDGYVVKIDTNYTEPITDISTIDINFDGIDDIKAEILIGAYNVGTQFYIQDPNTREFEPYEIASGPAYGPEYPTLGFVTVDTENKVLTNSSKGRGLGDIFTEQVYTFTDDALWEISTQEEQTFYTPPGMSESNGEQYYLNEFTDYRTNPPTIRKKYLKLEDGSNNFIEIHPHDL